MPRAVIAEDSVLLRIGVVKDLRMAGCEVVAERGDGEGLLAAVARHRPALAVVDVRMPPSFTDEGVRAALRRCWHGGGVTPWSGSPNANARCSP